MRQYFNVFQLFSWYRLNVDKIRNDNKKKILTRFLIFLWAAAGMFLYWHWTFDKNCVFMLSLMLSILMLGVSRRSTPYWTRGTSAWCTSTPSSRGWTLTGTDTGPRYSQCVTSTSEAGRLQSTCRTCSGRDIMVVSLLAGLSFTETVSPWITGNQPLSVSLSSTNQNWVGGRMSEIDVYSDLRV